MWVAALVAVSLAASLGVGCRTPVPGFVVLPPDDPRPARILSAWSRAAEQRVGLRGRARLAVDAAGGDVKLRGKQVIALERPERLRVEIKALFDQTVAVLVTDAGEFELLRADDHSYQRGAIHPGLLWETAWLDLEPSEAIALLLAAPSLGEAPVVLSARELPSGHLELDLGDASGRVARRVRFDAAGRLRAVEQLRVDGQRAWRAEYDGYAPVGDVVFPHTLRVVTAEATEAELQLVDVELNPSLSPELFRLRR
jgi:hypothetical protein